MAEENSKTRWSLKTSREVARVESQRRHASDDAIAELQQLVTAKLRSEKKKRRRPRTAGHAPEKNSNVLMPDAAKRARDAILNADAPEETDDKREPDIDDEWLYHDPTDRFSTADRVFSGIHLSVYVSGRIMASMLTVLAGCELAYACDLMLFESGSHGAILAAVVGCFAAARWITK